MLVIFDESRNFEPTDKAADSESVASLPQTDLPATAQPSPVSPAPVKSAHSNNSDSANTDCKNEREGVGEPVEDPKKIDIAFWRFVKDWPGFAPMAKEPARKLWHGLRTEDRKLAARSLPVWRKELANAKKDYVPLPQTYFKERLLGGVGGSGV